MIDRLFSRREDAQFGTYNHGNAIIEASFSTAATELVRSRQQANPHDRAPDERMLLEISALMHERLHYLQTYGTLAGMGVLSARVLALRRFINCSMALVMEDRHWQLPLSGWVASGTAPDPVRKLLRFARAVRAGSDVFLAPFKPFSHPDHLPDAWVNIEFASVTPEGVPTKTTVPAFPMAVAFVSREGAMRPMSVIQPLGYEALIEGIAHGATRTAVGILFPGLDEGTLQHFGPPKVFTDEELNDPDMVAQRYEIYTATDLMISKYLRSRGIRTFPRKLVFMLSDIALSLACFAIEDVDDRNTRVEIHNPGNVLIGVLESCSDAQLASGEVPYPAEVQAAYKSLHAALSSAPPNDFGSAAMDFYAADRVWEEFVVRKIQIPLLARRIESENALFYEESDMIQAAYELDLPRVEIVNGRLAFHGMPEEIQAAWAQQLFAGEIAQQVFADSTLLRCPKAHQLVAGLEHMDFCRGECRANMKLGCGTFVPGQANFSPSCLFSHAVDRLGFSGALRS